MSWFKIPKSFTAKTTAKAAEVNENFEEVEDALNELFKSARVQSTGKPTLGASYVEVPGTSKTIEVARASLLIVTATFDVSVSTATFTGNLEIDEATQTQEAVLNAAAGTIRGAVTQTYFKEIAKGSHTVKMVGKKNGSAEVFDVENTGYTYLVIPDPEP